MSVQEGGDTVELAASPIWADSVSLDSEKESGREFFRTKLNGKLTFVRDDYAWIMARAFEAEFATTLDISRDGGTTWSPYWYGVFYKTDCEIDKDEQKIIVTPTAKDRYNEVLDGMDKEFDLIQLAPEIVPVKFDKRPMVQVYVPGQSVIGCFLSGMWWEQECEVVEETDTVGAMNKLTDYLHFAKNATARVSDVTQQGSPTIPDAFLGSVDATQFTNGNFKINIVSGQGVTQWQIVRISDNTALWLVNNPSIPGEITLTPVSGSGATGNVKLYVRDVSVYARYVTDVVTVDNVTSYPIPADDMVPNNRNYSRVLQYLFQDRFIFSTLFSSTPTEYGLYKPGQYYEMATNPYVGIDKSFPVARSAWGSFSIWFAFPSIDWQVESEWRKEATLRDAYPIYSVISRLLGQISPSVTHQGTSTYSEFLYAQNNPISGISAKLFIAPKSNVINSGYDQPAQTAKVTLKQVLDMLRDCFRCYWFIDDSNRFRIEHIEYFRKGESYEDDPVVGVNLLAQKVSRNGKPWSYARNKYQF